VIDRQSIVVLVKIFVFCVGHFSTELFVASPGGFEAELPGRFGADGKQ